MSALIYSIEIGTTDPPRDAQAIFTGRRHRLVREETEVSPGTIQRDYYLESAVGSSGKDRLGQKSWDDSENVDKDARLALGDWIKKGIIDPDPI